MSLISADNSLFQSLRDYVAVQCRAKPFRLSLSLNCAILSEIAIWIREKLKHLLCLIKTVLSRSRETDLI